MIQIPKMNQYCAILVFFLFLLKPSLILAEEKDPFNNSIEDFEENVETTDQEIPDYAIDLLDNMGDGIDMAVGNTPITGLPFQPVHKRYPITQYFLQGLIKSPNKTQMMFVATDENVKFFLGMNDCLGLNCAYVTEIDKKGRVTFEDEKGIYLFEVGRGSYIVEQKGLIATENALFTPELAQIVTDSTCVVSGVSGIDPTLVPQDTCQCIFFNMWASMTQEDMEQLNTELATGFMKGVYEEEPDEQLEFVQKYLQAIGTLPLPSGAERAVITEEQSIRGAEEVTKAIINFKNLKAASLYCQETMGITESEATSWMLIPAYIEATAAHLYPGLDIGEPSLAKEPKEKEGIITIEGIEGIATESKPSLADADTQNLEDTIASLNAELENKSNALGDAENQIAVQEKQIDTLKNDLDTMLSSSDTPDADTQNLEDTIASLNAELDNKNITLNDAESKIAVQEKQIDTLKNDLDNMLSGSVAPDSNILQKLQDIIATQEQALDQKEENINLLQEELQNWVNSSTGADAAASSDDAQKSLQETITALQSELDNKNITLNDAESKITVQEKQISTLKNDLDTIFVDFNEKLNAKQELINNLKSQLLLAQSTAEPSVAEEQNEQTTESTATPSTAEPSSEQNVQSTESTATPSTEITSDANDVKGDNLMVSREDVNIREKPNPSSSIIGVLLKNNTINVLDTVQGWHKIITREGKDGYIYSPMLKEKN